ncbi:MAG: hypothetical protein ACLFQK_01315 [Fibrobacterota bacterium]
MALVQRTNKKSLMISVLIALAVNVVVGWIFWEVKGEQMYQDYVAKMQEARNPPPPKPPKVKAPKVNLEQPKIDVAFKVNTDLKLDVKPEFELDLFSGMDEGGGFEDLAADIDFGSYDIEDEQMTLSLGNLMQGLDLGIGSNKKVSVAGHGKRMRAKLHLTTLETPGQFIAPWSGNTKRDEWDAVIISEKIIPSARSWLNENTTIKISKSTRTMDLKTTYSDWVEDIQERGPKSTEGLGDDYELLAKNRLSDAIDKIFTDRISGKQKMIVRTRNSFFDYIEKKYFVDISEMAPDKAMDTLSRRNNLRDWRKEGIIMSIEAVRSLSPQQSETSLLKTVKPVYTFYRQSRMLQSPLILYTAVMFSPLANENLALIRHYIKNGGFIWVDEPGWGWIEVPENMRKFIYHVMSFDQPDIMSNVERRTFKKLNEDDSDIPGYNLESPFPNPGHPDVYIPISISDKSNIEINIYNRLGLLVKNYKKENVEAGTYFDKSAALRWECKNNSGEPVESGWYFCQMRSGLFQQTMPFRVDKLRKLDENHEVFKSVWKLSGVPLGNINKNSQHWDERPYGRGAFGWHLNNRLAVLYTEEAAVMRGISDANKLYGDAAGRNQSIIDQCGKFFHNVIGYVLTQPGSAAHDPCR